MVVAIVGGGPSALLLSYILKGNIPVYDPVTYGPHPDAQLHRLLSQFPTLLEALKDEELLRYVACTFESFFASNVLPADLLWDTLNIPNETNLMQLDTMQRRIAWRSEPKLAVDHVIFSDGPPGGQWSCTFVDTPTSRVLSYAEMVSLPVHPFSEFYEATNGKQPGEFYRPLREEVAAYFTWYQKKARLPFERSAVTSIRKLASGKFHVTHEHGESDVDSVVLASGVSSAPSDTTANVVLSEDHTLPVLVVGTGVSAAEAVLNPKGTVYHVYRWHDAKGRPTPLRKYPPRLYPEYSRVFQLMKAKSGPSYVGLPNGEVSDIDKATNTVTVIAENQERKLKVREVYFRKGRFGSLAYAEHILEPLHLDIVEPIQRDSLRTRCVPLPRPLDNVFLIGSLSGDSLIRFLGGLCIIAAGDMMRSSCL